MPSVAVVGDFQSVDESRRKGLPALPPGGLKPLDGRTLLELGVLELRTTECTPT